MEVTEATDESAVTTELMALSGRRPSGQMTQSPGIAKTATEPLHRHSSVSPTASVCSSTTAAAPKCCARAAVVVVAAASRVRRRCGRWCRCLCPPGGPVERCVVAVTVAATVAAASVAVLGGRWALPPGPVFGVQLLLAAALLGGRLAGLLRLPQLLGMLAAGLLLANIAPPPPLSLPPPPQTTTSTTTVAPSHPTAVTDNGSLQAFTANTATAQLFTATDSSQLTFTATPGRDTAAAAAAAAAAAGGGGAAAAAGGGGGGAGGGDGGDDDATAAPGPAAEDDDGGGGVEWLWWLYRVAPSIDSRLSAALRTGALACILTRAGLSLDGTALARLGATVVRLAAVPCAFETLSVCVAGHWLLQLPWLWSALLGAVLAAVSPAVVVPAMLSLQLRGYGVRSGVPTLINAAASVDDVLAITAFGVVLALIFAQGSVIGRLVTSVGELLLGAGYGLLAGALLHCLPSARHPARTLVRVTLLSALALIAVFASQTLGFAGAGPLACLTLGFVANHGWKNQPDSRNSDNPATETFAVFWFLFQPLLFALIGLELRLQQLRIDIVSYGLLVLLIGLSVRMAITYFVVMGSGLSVKERLFVSIAWLPKATVQAAIGPIALDFARTYAPTEHNLDYGQRILTLAVLAILLTAPLGAAAIAVAGPRLLDTPARAHSPSAPAPSVSNDQNRLDRH